MGLTVSAAVIRQLIIDGEYVIECLEQRDRGSVLLTLALRSRSQPYSIQIETTEHKLQGLFRALLPENASQTGKAPTLKVGSQPVPVVQVDAMPADAPKPRRRRTPAADQTAPQPAEGQPPRAERRRAAMRQLTLLAGASSARVASSPPQPGERPARARASQAGQHR
jgi:hypothetical protein